MDLPRLNTHVFAKKEVPVAASIGPAQLRARYNVTDVGTNQSNLQSVAEFQAQYFVPADLVTFYKKFVNGSSNDTITRVIGTNTPSSPGTEAELDVQYIMGVSQNIPTWVYSTAAFEFWSDLTSWISTLSGESQIPYVISVSYGDQFENQPSTVYKEGLNVDFMKLGARGASVIFASGDFGTGCDTCTIFQASFPATSPYVTSVGATTFMKGTGGPERAVQSFPSGGGFSHTFAPPSFQVPFIQEYFKVAQNLPKASFYNASGRGTPDVSALGDGFQVVQKGKTIVVGGTSAATPTFSAIVSLLNQQRFSEGKPSLGYLNPWIYQSAASTPDAFFDVTVGNNQYGCCRVGFSCAPGWDPVTGVGTPNYEVLKTLV